MFFFPGVRSSTDSVIIDADYQRSVAKNALARMIKEERYPELIIKAKQEAWTWGMERPNVLGYDPTYPYSVFADCAKGPTLIEEPELAIYSVKATDVANCARAAVN